MTDAAPATRRRPFWAIGAALWIGVFAALAAVFFLRGDREPADGAADGMVVTERGEGGVRLAPVGYEEPPKAEFDPDGLPEFSLTERRGETVTRKDFLGKTSVVGFIFTRCGSTCPRVSKSMMELRERLKDDGVQFVSISVDPGYDTPEILTTYSDMYGAQDDDGWLWLTGDRAKVYELIREGFEQPVAENEETADVGNKIFHTNNLMLVGPDGVVRGKYNALAEAETVALRREAQRLASERGAAGGDAT